MIELTEAELRSQSLWKKIVIGLGGVIFVMVGVLIAAMIIRSMKKTTPDVPVVQMSAGQVSTEASAVAAAHDLGQLKITLPIEATVEDVRFDGGLYIIRMQTPDRDWQVWVIDAQTGERRGELELNAP